MEGTTSAVESAMDQQTPGEGTIASDASVATEPVQQQEDAIDFSSLVYEVNGKQYTVQDILKGIKHKVKVDGQEKELDYDSLLKVNQLEQASQARMQKAAEIQKQAAQLLDGAKSDTDRFLSSLGIDPVQYAEQKLKAYLEDANLTDEQRELRQLRAEKQMIEKSKKEQEEAEQQKLRTAREQEVVQQLDDEISKTLAEAGIKNPKQRHVARIAEYLLASLADETAAQRMSSKDAYSKVREDLLQDAVEYVQDMEVDEIERRLPDLIKKIRLHDVNSVKKASLPSVKAGHALPKQEVKKQKSRSMDDFFNTLQPGNRLEI